MYIEVHDGKTLSSILTNVNELADEVVLEFSSEGLCFSLIDKASILFCKAEVKKEAFEGLDSLDEPVRLMVDSSFLGKVMKRVGSEELSFSFNDHELIIGIGVDQERKFSVPLIDNDYESPRPPVIEPSVRFDIIYSYFKNVLDDIKITNTDRLQLRIADGVLHLIGKTDMYNKAEARYSPLVCDCDGEVVGNYSINFIDIIMKFKLNDYVYLGLGTDLPLVVDLYDDTGDYHISFLLAPRLEND